MPELPEVETLVRQLQQAIVGKTIKIVKVYLPKSVKGDPTVLINKTIRTVRRQAKIIIIEFESKCLLILIHLKMTGQLIYQANNQQRIVGGHPTLDFINSLPSKHTRVEIHFTDGTKLYFNDQRTFGWLKIITTQTALDQELKTFSTVEPLKDSFTQDYLRRLLAKTRRPVKIAIMEQNKLAGVGNIYANDALFLAKIDPRRPANSLNKKEITTLYSCINQVIAKGIETGGASESTYRQLDGFLGSYQKHFLVYKKEGETCPNQCGGTITKIQLGGRGTYFCPICQQ